MAKRKARILILCKTYPSPSAQYSETSCVAGIEEDGKLIRLYPVPFRLIADTAKFKKWQWITAQIEKAKKDHRSESHRIASIPSSWTRRLLVRTMVGLSVDNG